MKIKAEICKQQLCMIKGLMFSKKKNLIFVFKKKMKINLHTFFVFYTINIYFLDESKKIIEIKENLKPFRFYFSKKKTKYIVESPHHLKVSEGEKITW